MLKYCCDKFRFLNSGVKNMGLNIRIVKLSKEFIERGNLDFDKSFLITEGYSNTIDECSQKIAINFCPFCGSNLKKFYKSDDYIQEIIKL